MIARSLVLSCALAACGPRDPGIAGHAADVDSCPASSLPQPGRCVPPGIHTFFDMPHNDMPAAGLGADSLRTNHDLLASLAARPLELELFGDSALQPLLLNRYAPDLVSYVVSCALDPCDAVELPELPALAALSVKLDGAFRGELGLCGERYELAGGAAEPGWRAGHPSAACLERVSACVLARTNALGSKVALSMRGEGIEPQPRVPTQTAFREHDGTPIASFGGCDAACLSGDRLARNCDWEPRFVGQCVSHSHVRLAATASDPNLRLRVCAGIYGCDSYTAHAGPPTLPATGLPRYGGVLIADALGSAVDFTCPDNGPVMADGTATGYYAVMAGSRSTSPLRPGVDVARVDDAGHPLDATPSAIYPAPETAVFTYREGAFYGTLFEPAVPPSPNGGEAMLSGHQYACYSNEWSDGLAAEAHRLCTGPASRCFVNPPEPCDDGIVPGRCRPQPPVPTPRVADECDGLDALSPPLSTWSAPYTSFLNHPCDLFATDEECLAAIDPNRYPWIVVRPTPPPPPQH